MLQTALAAIASKARIVLPLGLAAGVVAPTLASVLKPYIGPMIVILLFLASLRIGPRAALGALADLRTTLAAVIAFQLVVPLVFVVLVHLGGWSGAAVAALVLMMAASPISGTPSLTIMMAHDPAPALRLLILGTAMLPLTAFVVFWSAPGFGDTGTLIMASLRLLVLIALACATAFLIRGFWLKTLGPVALTNIDGLSALVMAVVVVGLMSAVGGALIDSPLQVAKMLALAFAANFGLQIAAAFILAKRGGSQYDLASLGVSAGNRNCALFLTALPAAVTDPLLLFIGCYQIPMYLTPMLLTRLYDRLSRK